MKFPLRIYSVNVPKSAGNCGYYITCLGLSNRKTSFTSKLNVSHTAYGRKVQNRHLISTKRTKKMFLTD